MPVRCGDLTIYGSTRSGFNLCTVDGGKVVGVSDPRTTRQDQDPRLRVDLLAGTAQISDDSPMYTVDFRVASPGGAERAVPKPR